MSDDFTSLYPYEPNVVLPIVFACIVGASLCIHIYQNFHYNAWRITFFMFWGGTVFTAGWICRAISVHNQLNLGLYISQLVLVLAGPPIYAAAEYNALSRMMHYLPMHAPLNPGRVIWVFIYLGISVETLTGAGAGRIAANRPGDYGYTVGGILVSTALVLQACVELTFTCFVVTIHRRAVEAGNCAPNVRRVCVMLYGTSALILLRCICRAAAEFEQYSSDCESGWQCGTLSTYEWYLYVFECVPMVLYSYWINLVHPARLLPVEHRRYLDLDGKTERIGPGWVDRRSRWQTFLDPFGWVFAREGWPEETKFWDRPEEWEVCTDGTFALGTATNVKKRPIEGGRVGAGQVMGWIKLRGGSGNLWRGGDEV